MKERKGGYKAEIGGLKRQLADALQKAYSFSDENTHLRRLCQQTSQYSSQDTSDIQQPRTMTFVSEQVPTDLQDPSAPQQTYEIQTARLGSLKTIEGNYSA